MRKLPQQTKSKIKSETFRTFHNGRTTQTSKGIAGVDRRIQILHSYDIHLWHSEWINGWIGEWRSPGKRARSWPSAVEYRKEELSLRNRGDNAADMEIARRKKGAQWKRLRDVGRGKGRAVSIIPYWWSRRNGWMNEWRVSDGGGVRCQIGL